jgi:hypothetical protein
LIAATFRAVDAAGCTEFVTDGGEVLRASADVASASVFRHLRVGQRVALELRDGAVLSITLPQ